MRTSNEISIARESARIAFAIQSFVMRAGDGGEIAEGGDPGEDHFTERRVPLHRGPFFGIELARLVEDGIADTELADVVEQRRAFEPAAALGRKPEFVRDNIGKERHAFAMAAGVRTFGIDDLGESGGDIVEVVFIDEGALLRRLERENRRLQFV